MDGTNRRCYWGGYRDTAEAGGGLDKLLLLLAAGKKTLLDDKQKLLLLLAAGKKTLLDDKQKLLLLLQLVGYM